MIKTAAQILAEIAVLGEDHDVRVDYVSPVKVGRPRLNKTCGLDWCIEPHKGNGFCNRHGWSWWKYGDPLATSRRANPPRQEDAHTWPFCTYKSQSFKGRNWSHGGDHYGGDAAQDR